MPVSILDNGARLGTPVPTEKSIPTEMKRIDRNSNQDDGDWPETMATQETRGDADF